MLKDMYFWDCEIHRLWMKNTWMERQQEWEGEYVCCLIWEYEKMGFQSWLRSHRVQWWEFIHHRHEMKATLWQLNNEYLHNLFDALYQQPVHIMQEGDSPRHLSYPCALTFSLIGKSTTNQTCNAGPA